MIELVEHSKHRWPSGFTSHNDSVHSLAERIGRQEVTLKGAIQAQCDMTIYSYNAERDELGLDPWQIIDGIDEWVNNEECDLWFESGSCKHVKYGEPSDYRFFVTQKELEAA